MLLSDSADRCQNANDYTHSESYCGVKIWGTFTSNLTNLHISFNVTTHFNDGRIGQMPGEDDFCKWMDVVQNDTSQCPPKAGKATLSSTALLLGGWVPEVSHLAPS